MKRTNNLQAWLWALVMAHLLGGESMAAEVAKTNPMKVYMHYMPWFETPDTLGGNNWGWHWRMNTQNPNIVLQNGQRQIASHYYPLIGPYASRDPDVIEYHLLLMKYSGVDGVLIDWYGVEGTNGDIGHLLTSSNAIVDRVDDFDMEFGVVLEDRFSASVNQAQANLAYLRDHYFNKPEYIRLGVDQDPLLPVFGPITFESQSEWSQILAQAGEPVDLLTLWYESNDAGSNADGEYAWVYESPGSNDHLAHQQNFYNNRAPSLDVAGGSVYPGFHDFYQEGGAGGTLLDIPHDDGQTLENLITLATAHASKVDFVQLATFNDFGEGTMFEPTVETGFDYLVKVQQYTGAPYSQDELELVHELYLARKAKEGDAAAQQILDQVSSHLSDLDVDHARWLIKTVDPPEVPGDYNYDGEVDAADHAVWSELYSSLALVPGGGADGNADGVVDAADYTLWRDRYDAAPAAGVSVPEPTSASLVGCVTLLLKIVAARGHSSDDEPSGP